MMIHNIFFEIYLICKTETGEAKKFIGTFNVRDVVREAAEHDVVLTERELYYKKYRGKGCQIPTNQPNTLLKILRIS